MFGPFGYRYSGVAHPPRALTPLLDGIRARVEAEAGAPFNSVLLNLYRDGNDAMGWHSDADYEHGGQPIIASVSFGADRPFDVERRQPPRERWRLLLADGSLLLMGAETQRWSRHRLARCRGVRLPRVNLTFRQMTR
jgi:alkylated DNA repair dioxygenase AlkB